MSIFRRWRKLPANAVSDYVRAIPAALLNPLRVLIVDDDLIMNALMSNVRNWHGLNVVVDSVTSVAAARARIFANEEYPPYDLLILDVVLTNGNGIDLYKDIVAKFPRLSVLFLTGYASDDVRRRIEKVGLARTHSKLEVCDTGKLAGLLYEYGAKPIFNVTPEPGPEPESVPT